MARIFPHRMAIESSKSGLNPEFFLTCSLPNVLSATTARTFSTSQLPKVLRDRRALPPFASKCASRHNSLHFFHISTSKSGPNLMCFETFYFQMCFAPQRPALFRHLNVKKCSGPGVFCTFSVSLQNLLCATTACAFLNLNFQKCSENDLS